MKPPNALTPRGVADVLAIVADQTRDKLEAINWLEELGQTIEEAMLEARHGGEEYRHEEFATQLGGELATEAVGPSCHLRAQFAVDSRVLRQRTSSWSFVRA